MSNPYDFDAVLEMGSYFCESCGYNYDELQAESDFFSFRLTDRTGCYNWQTVTVDTPQDAEDTLRDWASWHLDRGFVSQADLDAFVAQVRDAVAAFNAADARDRALHA